MEMKELLDKTIDVNYKADTFFFKKPVRAVPNGPATVADLLRLDAFLGTQGIKAPASYKSCLSIYNGIKDFLAPGYSLLSVDEVIGKTREISVRFDREYPDLVKFVIAASDDLDFMAFDVAAVDSGEGYEIGGVTAEGRGPRYTDFRSFLVEGLATLEQTIREQEKDRKKLKP